jgi:periplasmic copper chaperone A
MRPFIVTAIVSFLSLGATNPALAHAVINQTTAEPGTLITAEARITHGCAGQATNAVTITMPEGVTRVTPRAMSGWTVAVTMRDLPAPITLHGQQITQTVDTITWTGGSVPDFAWEQFEFRFQAPATPGRVLYFPLVQTCATASERWINIPSTIADWGRTPDPAPYIQLNDTPSARRGGHSH